MPRTQPVVSLVFDETNVNWNHIPDIVITFIRVQETYLNQLLATQGHVFLNEAFDLLGFQRTRDGALLGWVLGDHVPISIGIEPLERGVGFHLTLCPPGQIHNRI